MCSINCDYEYYLDFNNHTIRTTNIPITIQRNIPSIIIKNNSIKILNLILYSNNSHYENMKNILMPYLKYIKSILNFDFYFYCYDPNIKEDFIIKDHVLYIKGKETYIPGILEKTIRSFEIFKDVNYDYLVRTNISSIVDFKLLSVYLKINDIQYGGSKIWVEPNDTKFVSGTCIVIRKDLVLRLLKDKNKINYKIIDDLSLGIYVYKVLKINMVGFGIIYNTDKIQNKLIVYRNHRGVNKRTEDLVAMKKLISQLLVMEKFRYF